MSYISPVLQVSEDRITLPVSVKILSNVLERGYTTKDIRLEIILNEETLESEIIHYYYDYECENYGMYIFRLSVINKEDGAIEEQYNLYLDLVDFIELEELEIELTNNFGSAPLTFSVEDITDYSNTNFVPLYRQWNILNYGYVGKIECGVNKRWLTISKEGQYDIQLVVSDGNKTYTKTIKNAVIVLGEEFDGNQIEFSESLGTEVKRHFIKTEHSSTNNEHNNISFFIWGTEVLENELATNKVMQIQGNEATLMKNLIAKENKVYDIGAEENRWKNTILKLLEIKKETESKILELWSGK